MGNSKTTLKDRLDPKDVKSLVKTTKFTANQIELLYQKYAEISGSVTEDGVIDLEEFQRALGFKESDCIRRLFGAFDLNGDKYINFKEFCEGLSIYCGKVSFEKRIEFSFKIFDLDGNGTIDKEELFLMLRTCLFENSMLQLSEKQMRSLVDKTFQEVDTNNDGCISLDEYKKLINHNPHLLDNFTLNLDSPV